MFGIVTRRARHGRARQRSSVFICYSLLICTISYESYYEPGAEISKVLTLRRSRIRGRRRRRNGQIYKGPPPSGRGLTRISTQVLYVEHTI